MKFKLGFAIAAVATVALAPMTAAAHDNGYNHRHQSSGDDQLATARSVTANAPVKAIANGQRASKKRGGLHELLL